MKKKSRPAQHPVRPAATPARPVTGPVQPDDTPDTPRHQLDDALMATGWGTAEHIPRSVSIRSLVRFEPASSVPGPVDLYLFPEFLYLFPLPFFYKNKCGRHSIFFVSVPFIPTIVIVD
jgi:hypothetical protein